MNLLPHSSTLCNNVSCLRTGLSFGPELVVRQHTLLLAFLMLFLKDSNCNKSCLETCFSGLVPLIPQQQYVSPQRLPGTCSPWLILCHSYLRIYDLGKCLVEILQTLRYFFKCILSSQLRSI